MNPLHYPSLELCKKLTEAGFPRTQMEYAEVSQGIFVIENTDNDNYTCYSSYVAASVMELLDEMPKDFWANNKHYFLHIYFDIPTVEYTDSDEGNYLEGNNGHTIFCNESLPNALAEMYLFLKENGYIGK